MMLLVFVMSAYAANTVGMLFWSVYVVLCRPDISDRQIIWNLLVPFRFLWYF